MSRTLDQSRPFAEVFGLPGASFEQDGMLYKGDGSIAVSVEHIIDEIAATETEDSTPYIFCIEQKSDSSDPVSAQSEGGRNLRDMHWKHLKALLEVYGGTWENKEKAIDFLEGKA